MPYQKIPSGAGSLIDKFSEALQKVKSHREKKPISKGASGFREEHDGREADPEFRKLFFKNAPNKEGDFILAEKKKW